MARDYMGNNLIELEEQEKEFPHPSKLGHRVKENEIETLIDIDLVKFKAKNDNKIIKKTLSIPNYLNILGIEQGINFSQTLTEALKQKLGV